jgi:hypothetical protein
MAGEKQRTCAPAAASADPKQCEKGGTGRQCVRSAGDGGGKQQPKAQPPNA